MRKHSQRFLMAFLALLLQVFASIYAYQAPQIVYGNSVHLPETWLWPLTVAIFLLSGRFGLLLTCSASWLLLMRSRRIVAWSMIIVCCLPAWALSVFYLHAALVFLALV